MKSPSPRIPRPCGRSRPRLPEVRARFPRTAALAWALALGGCAGDEGLPVDAMSRIDTEGLAAHTRTLASDEFEGRAPATRGEERTIEYLRASFEEMGLEPGADGDWYQEVPLVSITADSDMELVVEGGDGTLELAYADDFMAWTKRVIDRSGLDESELVFAGYGIVAPEYGWNDYEGLDVRGKTVVLLVNDPGYATGDEELFRGRSMTYYGRWTYKYEEAARQGADGALIIHDTGPAGYPWEVVAGSWSGPQFGLVADDANLSRLAVEGWLTREAAGALFDAAGRDLEQLEREAAEGGFEAMPLGLRATVEIRNRVERSVSNNVVALVEGSERPDEVVVYMAHWDHLGVDESLEDDPIYNGAVDNATGTAGLLEVAEAFAALDPPPARSVAFLGVTAEEKGLLGSAHYVAEPLYPLDRTVAAINMDGLNTVGPMRDITVVGFGSSELDDLVQEAAARQDRVVRPDPEPEKGFYYRSDHFNFARRGVPALYTDGGIDHVERGESYGRRMREAYTAERYHKPSDEYDPSWDLSGAVDDLRLLFEVGYRLAEGSVWPNWAEGNEFRPVRDEMMR
ncbi:MAG: M28 family metallopeptidase [Gemmatimonadota bacterium]|nr:M28 family metallopeptidase [Gemmatimonadota bacterium]